MRGPPGGSFHWPAATPWRRTKCRCGGTPPARAHRLFASVRNSGLTARAGAGDCRGIRINQLAGNRKCLAEALAGLRGDDRVVVRYADNPSGSVDDIAGLCNEGRNVVGLMPHPERACNELLGSVDGRVMIGSLLASAGARV